MDQKYSQYKLIASEYERLGGKKGNDYGSGKFYNIYRGYTQAGGKKTKSIKSLVQAIKRANNNIRNVRRK